MTKKGLPTAEGVTDECKHHNGNKMVLFREWGMERALFTESYKDSFSLLHTHTQRPIMKI